MAIVPTLPPLNDSQKAAVIEYIRPSTALDPAGAYGLVALCAVLVLVFLFVFVLYVRLDAKVRLLQQSKAQSDLDLEQMAQQEAADELESRRQGVSSLDMGDRVSMYMHAVWYRNQLAAVEDAMANRGYRFVEAKEEEPAGLDFLPHDVQEHVARKLMIARSVYTHPRDPDTEHERHADAALVSGYAQLLTKEIVSCLVEEGFTIEFIGRIEGVAEDGAENEHQTIDYAGA